MATHIKDMHLTETVEKLSFEMFTIHVNVYEAELVEEDSKSKRYLIL